MTVFSIDPLKRAAAMVTHRVHSLPLLILTPHIGCDCRCVMCDIAEANANAVELTAADLAPHLASLRRLGVKWVVLSGGEPLLHANLWELCKLLLQLPARVSLLSSGLLLERHADAVTRYCSDVIVTLDGSPSVHDAIHRAPDAYEQLAAGIAALKARRATFRVTGRCALHKLNFADLPNIIDTAHALGLDGISCVPVNVISPTFPEVERGRELLLAPDEIAAFRAVVEYTIEHYGADIASGYIAESAAKLRRLPDYFAALLEAGDFPPVRCNAPWVSAVVEADGAVRPCYFHPPIGRLSGGTLDSVINSDVAREFRATLDVASDPICRRCASSVYLAPTRHVWLAAGT